MLSADCLHELRSSWLPNITDSALDRVIELLEQGSPYLIHGSFTRVPPMGCLATQVAWHHPQTNQYTLDAGIRWLSIAGLNPATSVVLREWDRCGPMGIEYRHDLLAELKAHRSERRQHPANANRIAKYIAA
ncbi:MAG: hypothetical protein U0744_14905 [Gemmataceae bacterium]